MKKIDDNPNTSLVDFPQEEKLKMKKAAQPVYRKFEKIVGKDLIRKIKALAPRKDLESKEVASY